MERFSEYPELKELIARTPRSWRIVQFEFADDDGAVFTGDYLQLGMQVTEAPGVLARIGSAVVICAPEWVIESLVKHMNERRKLAGLDQLPLILDNGILCAEA
jgi:hypothetical protein